VQSIIRELRGEKIDIVEWSEDASAYVVNALSPAKVSRVSIVDEEQRIMEVVVEDKQLSLAIGKKGQNVRLAAKLVGWRIDIKSEEEKRQEVEAEMARMARLVDEVRSLIDHGVSDKVVQKLVDAGTQGLVHLLEMSDEELTEIEGIGPKTAEKLRQAAADAKAAWDRRDAEEEASRQEAERRALEEAALEAAPEDEAAAPEEGGEAPEGEPAQAGEPAPTAEDEGEVKGDA
jgi:N utilization substance protein A